MMRSALRCLAIAALAFSASGLHAREPESFGERLAREHPVDCMQRVAPVVVADLVQRTLAAWLRGVGDARKLPRGWQPGNRHFDAALGLAYARAVLHETKHGAVARIDMQERFAHALDLGNAAERTQITEFLASPLGPFAWSHIIDDASCQGIIDALTRRKTILTDAHRRLIDSLQQGLTARRVANEKKMSALTLAQQKKIDTSTALIQGLFMKDDPAEKYPANQFGVDLMAIIKRLEPGLREIVPQLLEQADAFAAAAKP